MPLDCLCVSQECHGRDLKSNPSSWKFSPCAECLSLFSLCSLWFSDALEILDTIELQLNTQCPANRSYPDVPASLKLCMSKLNFLPLLS